MRNGSRTTLQLLIAATIAVAIGCVIAFIAARRTVSRDERDPPASLERVVLARSLLAHGELDAAARATREAVDLDSRSIEAQLALGDLLAAQRKWSEALAHYRAATLLDANEFRAHRGAANALGALDDTLGAERELRECVRLAAGDAESHMNLASNLAVQRRFAEAIDEMKRADELGSRAPDWKYPTKAWIAEFERELSEQGDAPKTSVER